jgi:hypothetical protein
MVSRDKGMNSASLGGPRIVILAIQQQQPHDTGAQDPYVYRFLSPCALFSLFLSHLVKVFLGDAARPLDAHVERSCRIGDVGAFD